MCKMHELRESICCHNRGRRAWGAQERTRRFQLYVPWKKHSRVWNKALWNDISTSQAAVSKCERCATKHILYSTHVCPFKRCPPRPPTDGGDVWCGRFSRRDTPTSRISSGAQIPRWPQHPGQPRSGLLYVSVDNSPACPPHRWGHAGSALCRSGLSKEIPASVVQSLLLHLEHEK